MTAFETRRGLILLYEPEPLDEKHTTRHRQWTLQGRGEGGRAPPPPKEEVERERRGHKFNGLVLEKVGPLRSAIREMKPLQ